MRANAHIVYSHPEEAVMARKPLTKPRKNASQERSRATVDVLVEATARILVKEGFDKASTNRIAAAAGVSIGSLYQYFPCKEALVAAVIDRHNGDLMGVVRDTLMDVMSLPLEKAVRRIVAVAMAAHRVDPRLHKVVAEQIPRSGRLENVEAFNRQYFDFFRGYLEAHADQVRRMDLGLAAFVCVTSIEAITHHAVLNHADMLSNERAEALIEEATQLIVRYLR
jgi:AcrR family transcriptional regulator